MAGRRISARRAEASANGASRRTTRASAIQSDSDSALELPFIPNPRASRNRRSGHRKTASFSTAAVPEEDEESDTTLRAARRVRTQSVHSHRYSPSTSTMARGGNTRRLGVRQSLTGPGVQETTIDERVDMVAGIAGDCLVKLLRLDGNGQDKGKQRMEEASRAWSVLQSSRELYLFSRESSLFPLLSDMTSSLHPNILNNIDTTQLVNTLALNNLATFIWVISQPDVAQELYRARDVAATPAKGKGKARARGLDDETLGHVRRRNAILLKAWKEFWNVAVPRNKRSSDRALELWLDFATIVYIFYQTPTIDPVSDGDASLPEITERVVDDLFSHSAVDRYGQWDLDEDGESQDESEQSGSDEKRVVDARWKQLANQRRRLIDQSALEVSMRKFPYSAFRQRVLAFVRDEVLGHSTQSALLPPSQYASLNAPYSPARSSARHRAYEDWNDLPDLKQETSLPDEEESDVLPDEEEVFDSELDQALAGEDEIDWDLAADVLDELEQEEEDFVRGAERLSLETSPRKREYRTSSPAKKRRRTSELQEWDQRNRHRSVEVSSFFGRKAKPTKPLFNWSRRQEDAVQIDWETQSAGRQPARSRVSAPLGLSVRPNDDTPRARATSNHLPRHSMSRVDELRSAQDIFRRRSATPTQSRLRSEGIVPAESLFRRVAQKFIPVAGIFQTEPVMEQEAEESGGEEEEDDDLMPSTQHIRGLSESRLDGDIEAGHQPSSTEIDADEEEMLPEEDEIRGANLESIPDAMMVDAQMDSIARSAPVAQTAEVHSDQNHALADIDINQEILNIDDAPATAFEEPAIPTSQTAFITSRHKISQPDAFATANPEEEEEDRQLLVERTPKARGGVKSSPFSPPRLLPRTPTPPMHNLSSVTPSSANRRSAVGTRFQVDTHPASPHASGSRAVSTPRASAQRAAPSSTPPKLDTYMIDEDGEPLDYDDSFVIPRGHVAPKSRLHGNVDGQASIYSRVSGRQKWTKDEELLLYRTVQQVPLSEIYPLRVVWHLHGEFGSLSHKLEMFNPQHMKDKMRVIVTRRINNQEPVEGRARAYLPGNHALKQAYEEEEKERKAELIAQRREETNRYIEEEEARRREASRTPRKKKGRKGRGGRKGKKRQETDEEDQLASDAEGDDEEQADDFDPDVEGEPELDSDGRPIKRAGPSWKVAPRSDPKKRTRSSGAAAAPDTPTSRRRRHARVRSPHEDGHPSSSPHAGQVASREARHAARAKRQQEAEAEAETEAEAEVEGDGEGEAELKPRRTRRGGRIEVEIPKNRGRGRPRNTPQPTSASDSPTTTQTSSKRNKRASADPSSAPTKGAPRQPLRAARKSAYSATSTNLATGKRVRLAGGAPPPTRSSRSRTREKAKSDSEDTPHEAEDEDENIVDEDILEEIVEENTQEREEQRDRENEEFVRREIIRRKVTAS